MSRSVREIATRLDSERPPLRLRGRDPTPHLRVDDSRWLGVPNLPGIGDLDQIIPDSERYGIGGTNVIGFADWEDKGLFDTHRWAPGTRRHSLRAIVNRHDDPKTEVVSLLWYNTYLLRFVSLAFILDNPIGSDGVIAEHRFEGKPDADQRLVEIGRRLADLDYDIVGLCEVFDQSDNEDLLDLITPADDASGGFGVSRKLLPGPGLLDVRVDTGLKGSGLTTYTENGPRIVRSQFQPFSNGGYALRDSDTYAGKGILHTEIDIGPGSIDLFTTHLLSGGDIPEGIETAVRIATGIQTLGFSEVAWSADDEPIPDIRRSQVDDLHAFIERRRRPENVTVVAGDFNMEGIPNDAGSEYDYLLQHMYDLGLQDLWLTRGGTDGGTHDIPDRCLIDPSDDAPFYCDDYAGRDGRQTKARIDFVFVELPSVEHSFTLDTGRVRRASFYRENGPPEEFDHEEGDDAIPHYLSDHVGLEVDLIASPGSA